ncbi:MAG: MBL fold metallo-hydrolase [Ruminococcus sp.]|nr:MBL fold metallo-hydrolase [Ruminococcus sp.]
MRIHTLNLGELGVNCYVAETAPGRCIAVDVGGDSGVLLSFLEEKALRLTKILITHGHFDHIGGVEQVRQATDCEVYIHELDAPMLSSTDLSLHSRMSMNRFIPVTLYTAITGDCYLNDGGCEFRVLHTPGHSPGSVCFICGDVIFSGDTLFRLSVGRTDFPGSSMNAMMWSMRQLAALDGDYTVYPGHGSATRLSTERKMNPYMRRAISER